MAKNAIKYIKKGKPYRFTLVLNFVLFSPPRSQGRSP